MKKVFFIPILTVLLLAALTACGGSETPLPQAPVDTPAQQATTPPTEAPVEPTAPVVASQTETPAAQQPSPVAPVIDGRELLESRCVSCHSIDRTTSKTGTPEYWAATVTRMIAGGAVLTEEEKTILVQYLAETFKK